MNESLINAAVLWSGGKDCSLALYQAVLAGYKVRYLITFAPPDARFLAHPVAVMQSQAESLGISHLIMEVVEPYAESYKAAIESLRDQYNIDTLITGDIAEVDSLPNWIRQCCEGTGVSVFTPLWGKRRETILTELMSNGFKIAFSCVKQPVLSLDWLGRELNEASFKALQDLSQMNGMDPCGENGEYHTVTLDGPLFKKKIVLASYRPVSEGSLAYIEIDKIILVDKS